MTLVANRCSTMESDYLFLHIILVVCLVSLEMVKAFLL